MNLINRLAINLYYVIFRIKKAGLFRDNADGIIMKDVYCGFLKEKSREMVNQPPGFYVLEKSLNLACLCINVYPSEGRIGTCSRH